MVEIGYERLLGGFIDFEQGLAIHAKSFSKRNYRHQPRTNLRTQVEETGRRNRAPSAVDDKKERDSGGLSYP